MSRLFTPGIPRLSVLLPCILLVGCGGEAGPEPEEESVAPPSNEASRTAPESARGWERTLVFLSAEGDSTWAMPWSFSALRREDRELRSWNVWLARSGQWEDLVREEGEGAAAGTRWRITPGGGIRLVVGAADEVERLILRSPTREAELELGLLLAQWQGPAGEQVRFRRGTLTLPSEEAQGFVLDLAPPSRDRDRTPGDWVFLHGGSEFQAVFLESIPVAEPRSPGHFRAWTRVAVREAVWPEATLEWMEARAFEAARRDVPVRWRVSSPTGEITGELEAVGSHLTAGEGQGPILPVDALFEVEGEVGVQGETFQVSGVIRHRQR